MTDKEKEYRKEQHKIWSLNNKEYKRKYNAKWERDNREKANKIKNNWRKNNPDKVRIIENSFYLRNPEIKLKSVKKYYKENRDKKLEYGKQYYYDNLKKNRERARQYYANNKEKIKARFKPGKVSSQQYRKTPEYELWRQEVYKRANYLCEKCNTKGILYAHHIKDAAKHPELRLDINNGKCLCLTCHRKIHYPNLIQNDMR